MGRKSLLSTPGRYPGRGRFKTPPVQPISRRRLRQGDDSETEGGDRRPGTAGGDLRGAGAGQDGLNNDDLVRNDALCSLPYGLGYRFQTRRFHGDHICSTTTQVTAFEAPRFVVEEWEGECPRRGRRVSGRARFEIVVDRGGTILVCDLTLPSPGFALMEVVVTALWNQARGLAKQIGMRAEALVLSRR